MLPRGPRIRVLPLAIHGTDLVDVHLSVPDFLEDGGSGPFNIGGGTGFSVREVLRREAGWAPRYDGIVRAARARHSAHPRGFGDRA